MFMSYDYYLGERRPVAEAVADLEELARMNQNRPYFMLLHIRQWSTIEHVIGILDQLGPEFEVVPPLADQTVGPRPDLAAKLAAAGIPQPEGSKVSYYTLTKKLYVRNTAPNLKLIEALLKRRQEAKSSNATPAQNP